MRDERMDQIRPPLELKNSLGAIPIGLAHVIHEITNPLTNLSLALQLFTHKIIRSSGDADPLMLTMLEEMKGEVNRMHTLVSSLRSHVQNLWQSNVTFDSLRLEPLIDELLESEAVSSEALGIRLHKEFSADLPLLRGNEALLKRALINLFRNAMEAMPQGGTLSVLAYAHEGSLILEIIDTGVGIPPDIDLFAPFATSKPEGLGLGLTITYNIINIHGGKITCMSRPGKGSTFRLTFPCGLQPAAALARQNEQPEEEIPECLSHAQESPGTVGEARAALGIEKH